MEESVSLKKIIRNVVIFFLVVAGTFFIGNTIYTKFFEENIYYKSFNKEVKKVFDDYQIKDYEIIRSSKCSESSVCIDGSCLFNKSKDHCYVYGLNIKINDDLTLENYSVEYSHRHLNLNKFKAIMSDKKTIEKNIDGIKNLQINLEPSFNYITEIDESFLSIYSMDYLNRIIKLRNSLTVQHYVDLSIIYNDNYALTISNETNAELEYNNGDKILSESFNPQRNIPLDELLKNLK